MTDAVDPGRDNEQHYAGAWTCIGRDACYACRLRRAELVLGMIVDARARCANLDAVSNLDTEIAAAILVLGRMKETK